ncbi:hypothetical protein BD626DRAFT_214121 [Schizophyllum amplum]|uniref:Uncharacterized protein n=1 Tax=Schizophyllum amplum TaxID=97359 RepID=A0A550BXS7_9AGAR|nr:hypothetical protein BD626DRAFT_214121 [Auriculariopsis ampla]
MPSNNNKSHTPQKLPKLFHKNRDRSKSLSVEASLSTSRASTNSPSPLDTSPATTGLQSGEPTPRPADVGSLALSDEDLADDAPVIIETASPISPASSPPPTRPRPRSERPKSDIPHHASPPIPVSPSTSYAHPSLYASTSSTGSRLSVTDLPARLSGWLSHMTSSSAGSPPQVLISPTKSSGRPSSSASPSKRGILSNNALITAARHGKSSLDKAMRFLLDSDARPDGCTEEIWIMGIRHAGFVPPPIEGLDTIVDLGERPREGLSPSDAQLRLSPSDAHSGYPQHPHPKSAARSSAQ